MRATLCAAVACCLAACAASAPKDDPHGPATLLLIIQCSAPVAIVATTKDGSVEAFDDVSPADLDAVAKTLPDRSVATLKLPCDKQTT